MGGLAQVEAILLALPILHNTPGGRNHNHVRNNHGRNNLRARGNAPLRDHDHKNLSFLPVMCPLW